MKTVPFTKRYGERTVLDLPALELQPGKIYAVIGANGSGKSTLAGILSGVLSADGNRTVLPQAVTVGYMPQRSFPFRMSVEANLRLGGHDPARAKELMEALDLTSLARRGAKSLSGGETAKLALARVLMGRRDLLILDEPTASMDVRSALMTEALIAKECEAGTCVVLITHSIPQARRLAHQVLFLHGGELAEHGDAAQVLRFPKDPRTQEFLRFFGMEEV